MHRRATSDHPAGALLPIVVRSRFWPIVAVGLSGAAVALAMVALRRTELDGDDDLMAAATLVLGVWLVTQSVGLLVRRITAGHAMRLDDRGLHHPGWDVVPWAAIRGASLRRLPAPLHRQRYELVLDLDPSCPGPRAGTYVRWMFGPIEGLWRRGRPIRMPLVALDVAPEALLAAVEAARSQPHEKEPR